MKVFKINIKENLLAVDEALSLVQTELETLKLDKEAKILKVVHGYGSKGVGGKIKSELAVLLGNLKKFGKILDFVQNEKFAPTSERYKYFTKKYPELILDKDLSNLNPGITLIFLA